MGPRDSTLRTFLWTWGAPLALALPLLVAPLLLSDFRLNLLGKFLTFAIVALGLDLIWGYGGMLSLGQGLFFGLGGYAMAMYLKLETSGARLPDFMSWSGREALPFFWEPFRSPVVAVSAAVLVPMVVASAVGYLVFRSRVQGVYFSLITQALTLIASILFIGQQAVTGGTNGITNLKTIFGFARGNAATQTVLYFVTLFCLGALYLLCRRLTQSRFGRLLVAMRDDENRVRFLGYNPVALKTLVFALSAGMAGVAGALFVCQVGLISPSSMGVMPSIEMVTWVAVGGRGTLVGAVLGAILVSLGKSALSESYPEVWQLGFGLLFAASVMLLPTGVAGFVRRAAAKLARRDASGAGAGALGARDNVASAGSASAGEVDAGASPEAPAAPVR
ncbi:amino acid ABC transporter permease [Sorangium cellulosum]|uniref:Amino acid ABC transporter permease n=1 Tax=Sorangium cellulosum TaxID=56 RepID=A0A2L0F1A9_SORCE|nr:urea ABC transporter permease subunit UrtC [Sorangium cellulosum]AUX45368.1 amino acid ABC transporter permease [Sorangium cellulosum]